MSTDQPDPDPFRKREQAGGQSEGPDRPPYGGAPDPYGSPPPPPGGGPYDRNPYGDMTGAADPLAGMPPLANRGKRLLARITDALLIGIPVGLVMAFAQGGWDRDSGVTYLQQAVYTVVYLTYEGLMLTHSGQTVGKRLMKIRVAVLADGAVPRGTPGWIRALVYQLPALVPCVGFFFWLLNVLFCTWDRPYQQCIHDKVAKTVVVATDQPVNGRQANSGSVNGQPMAG